MIEAIIITVCVINGILSYALIFAHMQRNYPSLAADHYKTDHMKSIEIGLKSLFLPVVSLVILYFLTERFKHGLMFK